MAKLLTRLIVGCDIKYFSGYKNLTFLFLNPIVLPWFDAAVNL